MQKEVSFRVVDSKSDDPIRPDAVAVNGKNVEFEYDNGTVSAVIAVREDSQSVRLTLRKSGYVDMAQTVEVDALDGSSYAMTPTQSDSEVETKINWGRPSSGHLNLDAHMLVYDQDGNKLDEVHFEDKAYRDENTEVVLDRDDFGDGLGETVTISPVYAGYRYLFVVYDYSNYAKPGNRKLSDSGATAVVTVDNVEAAEIVAPAGKEGVFWTVYEIVDGKLRIINEISTENEHRIIPATEREPDIHIDINFNDGDPPTTTWYTYHDDDEVVVPDPEREGYEFAGWEPPLPKYVKGPSGHTAQWRALQYTATFDANGGEGGGIITQEYGSPLSAPAVTRAGYGLSGWTPPVPPTMPAADTVYTALWEKRAGETKIYFTDGTSVSAEVSGTLDKQALYGMGAMNNRFYWLKDPVCADIGSGVTALGTKIFEDRINLLSVALPDTLRSIDSGVFMQCRSLTDAVLPPDVSSIGDDAFYNCANLRNFADNLSSLQASIGNRAFYKCARLSDGDGRVVIGPVFCYYAKQAETVEIPDGITRIDSYAFDSNRLTSVVIPDGVVSVGMLAFGNCYSLRQVEIGKNTQYIAEKAFANCLSLSTLVIPDNVRTIGDYLFFGCQNLREINFGRQLEQIGQQIFSGCERLSAVSFDMTVDEVKSLSASTWKTPAGCVIHCTDGDIAS